MKASLFAGILFAEAALGLNILLNNDDGFGVSNIREFYRLLVAAGHNVYMVAPATEQSGKGGSMAFAPGPNLTEPAQYDLVPAGAPSVGHEPDDDHIWYYAGSPSICTMVGLDYVLPLVANFTEPDLFVSGPNFGNNIGTYAFTGSGTIGGAYTAVYRNIPAVAFSGANPTKSYLDMSNSTTDPATLVARQAVKFVNHLVDVTKPGERILPLGYGLNVNIPQLNCTCRDPPFVESRFTGNSGMIRTFYNETNGVVSIVGPDYLGFITDGANQCFNGNCDLPGESDVIRNCQTAVSIFTVDYAAPTNHQTTKVERRLFH